MSGGMKPKLVPNCIRSDNYMITFEVEEEKPLANDIKIIFQKFTFVKKLEEDIISIPKNGFQFISVGLVHSRVNDDTILSDYVANGVHFIENTDEKKRRDEDMLLERMMINDLLCATWDKDMKVPFIIVRRTITSIVSSLGWFYKECKACYKQLTTIDGGYFCGNCKAESEFPLVL
ncbi:Nucleic acid-binding, OB-fold [Cynara cardunculus var. scolymus]|uniref:Nucleic acid-binding, OB-fold n=1 Tax=Cynara cardunculus var. scolymus TaxID=59895 RepID=A0A103VW56_CYNCS|nr:Nucleic acid-binding, OB-fold [Cynara cardunculus var. scolymus]